MESWGSYPSIFNIGHRATQDLFSVPVNIEEKVDGSQFSFGIDADAVIHVRSKGAVLIADAPEKMFAKAVETVKELAPRLVPGWTYRAEYLQKPKHNTLAYDRVPEKNLILFDVNTGDQSYLDYPTKAEEADRLGLEVVPLFANSVWIKSAEQFREYLDNVSILGGQKVEGVVVKPTAYNLYAPDKKVLMGKFVSEAFKEIHQGEWKKNNPSKSDIIDKLIEEFRTPARWNKAIQHLSEAGKLEGSPRDIGPLVHEIPADVEKEGREYIMERLYKYAWPQISRGVIKGFPEYYKQQLLDKQFEKAA